MHAIDIPDTILDRVARFRAQRHMFSDLDPRRTAHIVVDLQNGFMEPGAPVEVPTAREIVPNVNRITQAVRDAGGTIVYLRFMTDAGALASWSAFYDAMFNRARRDEMHAAFRSGQPSFRTVAGASTCSHRTGSSTRRASAPSSPAPATWMNGCVRPGSIP